MAPHLYFNRCFSFCSLLGSTFGTRETTKQLTQKLNYLDAHKLAWERLFFWGVGGCITIAGRDKVYPTRYVLDTQRTGSSFLICLLICLLLSQNLRELSTVASDEFL